MLKNYNHQAVEKKWQKKWEEEKIFQVDLDKAKKPFYNLMMFPYPSAEGLHVGNMYAFVHSDVYGRFIRLKGYDVFEPIGLDGFGIHSENYAIKIGEHIKDVSNRTEKKFYQQLHSIGNAYDWSKTVETYKSNYYKWTQWLFLQMHKKGLAYRKESLVNWCPSCKTVLSDEQVISGECERCGAKTEKKSMNQWFFRITDYAEKLLGNLETIDWSEDVKLIQKNWIGRSEGVIVNFSVILERANKNERSDRISRSYRSANVTLQDDNCELEVFTTRPDTLFGCTYMVVAPEHKLIKNYESEIKNYKEVKKYIEQANKKSDLERTDLAKEKTGVKIEGLMAINPVNNKEIPIFVADYVLAGYGTGAIMAVPAHDERDWEFAKKYNLEIIKVVNGGENVQEEVYTGNGVSVNSDFLDGLETKEAISKMIVWLEEKALGKKSINYRLRDWCVSRQRYWGPPIPMVYCEKCAKTKPKILLVHGIYGHSKENWFPWFKKEMEAQGYEVLIPDLPNANNPKLVEWIKALENLNLNKDDKIYVVAHSLGSPTACQFIIKNKLNIEKLILVAPVGKSMGEKNWKNLKEAGCSEEDLICIKSFNKANTNLNELNKYVKSSVMYLSDNDPFIPLSVASDYQELKADKKIFKDKGHFNESAGIKKFLEILEEFLSNPDMGWQAIPEKDLPVELPEMADFLPDGSGKGPLNKIESFVNTTCPKCGGPAKRETDVSDPFVDSCWYYMRYLCTDFDNKALDKERLKNWMPVNMYIGGKEHSVLHLLYSRFVTMVMHELGYAPTEEPFKQFRAHGLLIKDGAKISKSKGNIVNPDEYVEKYGADAVRMYLMFLGDMRQGGDWRDSGMGGMYRFVNKIYRILLNINQKNIEKADKQTLILINKTIKGVENDLNNLKYNTAISKLMIMVNRWQEVNCSQDNFSKFAVLLAPFAPHLAEEIWEQLGNKDSVFKAKWPEYDKKLVKDDMIELVLQINGKVRDKVEVSADISEDEAKKIALESQAIKKWTENKEVIKIIFIKGKLINIVIK